MLTQAELWEKTVAFHGHSCPGLAIGFKTALYARELLGLTFSQDEELVCVAENDACGVDAISVVLGCSVGKGNLLFRQRGKQAFSFFNRNTGKNIRLVFKGGNLGDISKDERREMLLNTPHDELFEVKDVPFALPEEARLFRSIPCEKCGETTAENHIRLQDGKKLCLDCHQPYSRLI